MKQKINYYWPILIPLTFSIATVYFESLIIFGLFLLSIFAVLKFNMLYMFNENIWGFIIVVISFVPINYYIVFGTYEHVEGDLPLAIYTVSINLIFCILLFCAEEIIIGTVIRLIWRRQFDLY